MKGNTLLSEIVAQKLPKDDKDEHEKEVSVLMALYRKFLKSIAIGEDEWESLEELMAERADWIIRQAFSAYGILFDDALELLNDEGELDSEETEKRDVLYAAVDNLVDFSVAEEYQMAEEVTDMIDDFDIDFDVNFEDGSEYWEDLEGVFKKYNDRYARVENLDAQYAMIMAAYFATLKNETVLMYMTMGDERVRPWHRQHEGFTAPKSSFPEWLIPPIEHQCRCFLIEDTASSIGSVMAQATPEMPDWFDRTFKESVAKGGRIFSDEHPYFTVDELHVGRLNAIANRIKSKYCKWHTSR